MTVTNDDQTITGETVPRFRQQPVDPLRDIHKGIRAALFAVTSEAGRVDAVDDIGVVALESELRGVAQLLADHAHHEDAHVDLSMLPVDVAQRMERDHAALDARMNWLVDLAGQARHADAARRRPALHELYLELASFTGAYLAHQDLEERIVVPTLTDRIGADGVLDIHGRIVAGMSAEQRTRGLVAMLPAVNVDDRSEMIAGIRAGMPDEAFAGVWSLVASVLTPHDAAALAGRLGI